MTVATAKPNVLIIDDDDDFAHAIVCVLEEEGYTVRRAADGAQGVAAAREMSPDLILLDFMMPIKDGFDACKELRTIPALRHVPIVAMTAFGQDIGIVYGTDRDSSKFDIQDCLEKPVEINVLLQRMADLLPQR
jgi:DNA-binding response OmpR family regulator